MVLRTAGWSAAAALLVLAVGFVPSGDSGSGRSVTSSSARGAAPGSPGVQTAAANTPMLPLFARTTDGHLRAYEPKGTGGLESAVDLGTGYSAATALVRIPISGSGGAQDLYIRMNNALYYTAERGTETKLLGTGWDTYNLLMTPGDLGGTTQPDLLGRDTTGALWLYQSKADGTFAPRVRAGSGGWNGMDALAGYGDYTGDGKADLLARTPTGTLYIYPGTGSTAADASLGTRITVGTGWNAYKSLVSTGDNSGDGKADLIATDAAGALWLFKGTGSTSAPFAARVQIGTSGWAGFNALF
ncbi:FG-GAP repeat domain-containing protein [Streptomyces sp. NPDC086787]|uniref:FG-GAP repeat domain-containing protein n=1 Tax=Streptomyces sp. NPDC086787 TaxID=3365759 RepID=UPI00382B978E